MMKFWLFMTAVALSFPLLMIGFGSVYRKRPPGQIGAPFGYRTARSTRNAQTWAFAHTYFGKLWYAWGIGLLIAAVLVMAALYGQDFDTVGLYTELYIIVETVLGLFLPIFLTEAALKRTFDRSGNRIDGTDGSTGPE